MYIKQNNLAEGCLSQELLKVPKPSSLAWNSFVIVNHFYTGFGPPVVTINAMKVLFN